MDKTHELKSIKSLPPSLFLSVPLPHIPRKKWEPPESGEKLYCGLRREIGEERRVDTISSGERRSQLEGTEVLAREATGKTRISRKTPTDGGGKGKKIEE